LLGSHQKNRKKQQYILSLLVDFLLSSSVISVQSTGIAERKPGKIHRPATVAFDILK